MCQNTINPRSPSPCQLLFAAPFSFMTCVCPMSALSSVSIQGDRMSARVASPEKLLGITQDYSNIAHSTAYYNYYYVVLDLKELKVYRGRQICKEISAQEWGKGFMKNAEGVQVGHGFGSLKMTKRTWWRRLRSEPPNDRCEGLSPTEKKEF